MYRIIRNFKKPYVLKIPFRFNSTSKKSQDVTFIRNIGIMAHIDAGKTTTTERMLYYSGLINQMGEVHHGNTVTDYMSQERERGITITSAAITFNWKNHQFNLIDTPGHIDFTMEVEQTLSVLDGGIVVLDGSAGVEAQTLTVWRQADRYNIPRIVFINKMDREDASAVLSCKSIEQKLDVPTLCLQLPIKENKKLVGIVDVISLEKIIYDKDKSREMTITDLTEKSDPELWNEAMQTRSEIVDCLSGFNDNLANMIINSESLDNVPVFDIVQALREATINQRAVPVLLGSAYKNIGVQPLMDSVILYLPNPNEKNRHFTCFDDNLCARAFKVIHEKYKGPLVFFRIYNGVYNKNQRIYSIHREFSENSGKLYVPHADDFKEVENISNGNIAVVSGLKQTCSGDLVTTTRSASERAKNKMLKMSSKLNLKEEDVENIFRTGARIPEPVFFCSIEPPSLASQSALEVALDELQREDPSLRVSYDAETGQTVLSGMGELHLEIIKDRILKEYKINAELGPLQIAYREAPGKQVTENAVVDTKIGNSKQRVNVKLSLLPTTKKGKDNLKLDKTQDAASNIAGIYPKHLLAIKQGIDVALAHGPKLGCNVVNCQVMLHFFEAGRGTSESMISATVTQTVQRMLKESGTNILEPIMLLEVVTPEEYLSGIMADLSRRRTEIHSVALRGNTKVVIANVPLAELMGYSTLLRTLSSGTASFTMEFDKYQMMSNADEDAAISNVRGF